MLIFYVTTLNGETRRINEKALRRMIKHMSAIKNIMRNLQFERNLANGDSESSGSDDSESSGSGDSESSGSGDSESSGTGSEGSESSGSEGSESSGSEGSEGSGSEGSEGSGSEGSEGSGSEASEGSGSEASEGSESQSLEESESSPSSPNITAPLTANPDFTGRRRTRINILAFNSFKRGNKSISFAVFFLFTQPPFYRIITFILTIRYFKRNRFRYLQEDKNETVTCNAQSDITEGKNARYSCNSSINGNSDDIEQVAIVDINIPSLEEINFSDEALLASSNLQNFVDEVNNMYDLKNGELKYSNNYFVIKGDIDDYQGKPEDEFRLRVYDNSSGIGILKNASCSVQSITNKKYQFKCTSDKDIDGYVHLASMYDDNKNAINLYMNEGNETLSFKGNGNNGNIQRSNPIYKKSSSGLSGGAIAGIVIACAVVLIIASIIAMMLRKPSVPIKNNSSITELRSIDNYTQ